MAIIRTVWTRRASLSALMHVLHVVVMIYAQVQNFLQCQKNLMQLLEKGSFTLSPWSQWLTMIKLVPINLLDGVLD